MFFWTSAAAQVALRMETMRKAEAALVALARRFGEGETSSASSSSSSPSYTMELFDTVISSSFLPFRKDQGICSNDASNNDEPLTMHAIRVTKDKSQEQPSNRFGWRNQQPEQEQGQEQEHQYPLVIVHGYMNGALYFYRNLTGLANYFNTVVSVDLLGWGLSSRPSFGLLRDDSVETAEAFFVESLEAWRSANKIEKMTLAGHSMGGYLSVAYCEKYPERVDSLLLLSPAGVPEHTAEKEAERRARFFDTVPKRLVFGLFSSLWEMGYTPGSLLRALPESRGREMVERYVKGRLPAITDPHEQAVLSEYMYTGNILPASGEYCLSRILNPGVNAKKPLVHRIPKLNVERVSMFYGTHDWMDVRGGLDTQRACLASEDQTTPRVGVYKVKNAGHLLMLENSKGFNTAVELAVGQKIPEGAKEEDLPVVLDVRVLDEMEEASMATRRHSTGQASNPIPTGSGSGGSGSGMQTTV
mmetsp:Transcript_20253/g.47445  ORF Transcript_20253/g.47445 Transcript_20253/m.47445 type:complete len:473 (-) Transcript_20253:402-1820(-)